MTIYLSSYQTFTTVEEMDGHIKKHLKKHVDLLNDTDQTILLLLANYCCKYPGAAHLKVETICGLSKKSESTVRRALRKLESLFIIRKISTIRRVTRGHGANILIILPANDKADLTGRSENEKQAAPRIENPIGEKESIIPLILNNKLLSNTYPPTETYYEHFKSVIVSKLGKSPTLVRRLFGAYKGLTHKVISGFPQFQSDYERIGYRALIISLQATKEKKIRNLPGYYVGVFEKLCLQEMFYFFQENE